MTVQQAKEEKAVMIQAIKDAISAFTDKTGIIPDVNCLTVTETNLHGQTFGYVQVTAEARL